MKTTDALAISHLLGRIFSAIYEDDAHMLVFDDELARKTASGLCQLPIGRQSSYVDFICYDSFAVSPRRALLPSCVRRTEPKGWQWRLHQVSKKSYAFRLERIDSIHPSRFSLLNHLIPDATPGIIAFNSLSVQQALLAKIRYNRLIDIFLGITAYSLQNHLRTTVKGLGQIEIDEVYIGVDRFGCQYIVPVQAKGGSDQLSTVQAKQDIACCAEKFPNLVCRAISAQFMDDSKIAIFELCLDEVGLVKTVEERHYQLVPADRIDVTELESYRSRTPR
jgi:hypothetical protein